MATAEQHPYVPSQANSNPSHAEGPTDYGAGWKTFAGTMLLIAATFNIIDGLVAITNSNYYASIAASHSVHLPITDNIHAWGWVSLAFGIVLLLPGFGVFSGAMWARVLGVVLVGLNMIFRMAFLPSFPFWGLVILFIDGLIIYGLVVHGGREPEYA